jgi:predicted ATPase
MVLLHAAVLHRFGRDEASARKSAESCIAIATEHILPQWLAGARVVRGSSLSPLEGRGEGIAQMRKAMADWAATAAVLYRPIFLAFIAEACWHLGRLDEASAAVAEATTIIKETGERLYEAEVLRLRGELALARSPADPVAAEAAFRVALEVARHQDARSWELRATTSLARLWQRRGKREEARQILADAYAWFTEGHETPDLHDARALLGELA